MTENLDPVPSTTEENTTTNTALNTFNDSSISESIPDKFKVTAEDGSVDYKATLSKMNESYTGLEKRIGSGDLPPKDVAGYKVDRDGFDFKQFKSDESNQAFLTKAHEHGITNK
ncbi:hypothetical protein OHX01_17970, partial [Acinetobacter baumannii]|nr:hypothetical protein [Acinetobacter baumannii]